MVRAGSLYGSILWAALRVAATGIDENEAKETDRSDVTVGSKDEGNTEGWNVIARGIRSFLAPS